jgi:hypothetical protein
VAAEEAPRDKCNKELIEKEAIMSSTIKRVLTRGAVLAIILLLGWFVYDRLVTNRFTTLLYSNVISHGRYPYTSGAAGTLLFWGMLGAGLLLLLVVGLLQSRQPQTEHLATDSATSSTTVEICPGCGMDVQSNWNLCPYCGYELP